MSPSRHLALLALGATAVAVSEPQPRTLLVHVDRDRLDDMGGADALYEVLSGRGDLFRFYDTFRIATDGGAAPGAPDPLVRTLAGTGGPAVAPPGGPGPLEGLVVAVSPAHGVYYSEEREVWTTQRGEHNGIVEDEWTRSFVTLWLAPQLEAAGAAVLDARCPLGGDDEVVVLAGEGDLQVVSGSWTAAPGAALACVPGAAGCAAAFTLEPPSTDVHPLFVLHPDAGGPQADALWSVGQADESVDVRIRPEEHAGMWTYLGRFALDAGEPVTLEVRPAEGERAPLVVGGARLGGGEGDVVRGGTTSGRARSAEGATYWLQAAGAPEWVARASELDLHSDRRARGRLAAWAGADVFLSVHTNGGGGSGTVTFIHGSSPPAGSEELARAVQSSVVETVRAGWDPEWTDRGVKRADLDELADARPMPAVLLEVGFHDSEHDAALLRHPLLRAAVSRSVTGALARELGGADAEPPAPPRITHVLNLGAGRLLVSWEPGRAAGVADAADSYELYVSSSHLVGESRPLGECCSRTVDGLVPGRVAVLRVAARNEGGASLLSSAAAVVVGDAPADALLVDGFTVLDEVIDETVNTGGAALSHARALRVAGGASAADFASAGGASLALETGAYELVWWWVGAACRSGACLGEEHAALLRDHLQGGGSVVLGGEDVAGRLLDGGGAGASLLVSDCGAFPLDGPPCEGPLSVRGAAAPLVTGPGADGAYACGRFAALAPLSRAHAVAWCAAGGAAAVVTPGRPGAGGGCALVNLPLSAAGDRRGRGELAAALVAPLAGADGPRDLPASGTYGAGPGPRVEPARPEPGGCCVSHVH